MSLQYIIDGYNIIHNINFAQGHKKMKDSKAALLEFIKTKRLTGSTRNKITVVFDGYADEKDLKNVYPEVEIIFSCHETADQRIKRMLEKSANYKNTVVVSDDKEIKFFAKAAGARWMNIAEFTQRKQNPAYLARDTLKPELTYHQMQQINKELKKIWLG